MLVGLVIIALDTHQLLLVQPHRSEISCFSGLHLNTDQQPPLTADLLASALDGVSTLSINHPERPQEAFTALSARGSSWTELFDSASVELRGYVWQPYLSSLPWIRVTRHKNNFSMRYTIILETVHTQLSRVCQNKNCSVNIS